jgi:hypothetical protein
MTDLVTIVSSDNLGEWKHVLKVIEGMEWNNIYVLVNEEANKKFKANKPIQKIVIDPKKTTLQIISHIKQHLEGKFDDMCVAVNMISGSGKEHMAIVSALLQMGLGIRICALTEKGVKEISL